ncbi:MAG TPA: hypothetical protein VLL07_02700 [Pontiella sp.]|nr:hypothetical protein [Pontiella sp.]
MKIAGSIFLIISALLILAGYTGLRKSEDRIKREILHQVRWGDDISEVRDFLISADYRIIRESRTTGFRDYRVEPTITTGQMHIDVKLGEYGIFIKTYVFAYFAFDGEGRLIDIWINKEADTL